MRGLSRRRTALVAVTALVVTTLAACGGDSPPPPTPAATPSPTTAVTSTPAPAATSTPTTAATATPTTAATSTPTTAATSTPTAAVTTAPTTAVTPTPTAAVTTAPTTAVTPTPTTAATPTPTPAATATREPVTIVSLQPTSIGLDTPPGPFTAIAVGGHRGACAIAESGEIVCWDWGDGAKAITLPGRYVAIDADRGVTCAVTDAGEAGCWRGDDRGGVLRSGGFTAIGTNGAYTCAVTEAGEIRCWLPFSDKAEDFEWPLGVPAPPGDPFVAVTVGAAVFVDPPITGATVCAARVGGGRECWLEVPPHHTDGRVDQSPRDGEPSAPLVGSDFCSVNGWGFPDCDEFGARYTVVSRSREHVCGVTPDGLAECRTVGAFALAYGAFDVVDPPDVSPARYVAISMTEVFREADAEAYAEVYGCGRNEPVDLCPDTDVVACALTDAGEAVCWRSIHNKAAPPDPQPGRYVAVSDGGYHTCALTEEGAVICWGWNNFGQAGSPSGRYTAVSAGKFHTCAVAEDGELVCWGLIDEPPDGKYTALSESEASACARRVDGVWACWGLSEYTDFRDVVPSPSQARWAAVSLGEGQSCVLRRSREAFCGQMYGQTDEPPGPFTAIGVGEYRTCALTDPGEVVCWGWRGVPDRDVPEGPYKALAVGQHHACALTDAGEVACWVWSYEKDKSGEVHGTPYEDALTNPPPGTYIAISSGKDRTCAVTEAGEVVCWGDVSYAAPPGPAWSPM